MHTYACQRLRGPADGVVRTYCLGCFPWASVNLKMLMLWSRCALEAASAATPAAAAPAAGQEAVAAAAAGSSPEVSPTTTEGVGPVQEAARLLGR